MKCALFFAVVQLLISRLNALRPLVTKSAVVPVPVPILKPLETKKEEIKYTNDMKIDKTNIITLMKDIDNENVDEVFYTDDYKTLYFKELEPTMGSPFKQVESNPLITNRILTMTDKKEIKTYIMEAPSNPIVQGFNTILSAGENLIGPFIVFAIIRSIVMMQRIQNPMSGGGNPFLPGGKKSKTEMTKLTVDNSNITLSSWAGSPEIFEECTEIVSYLKNATVYENAGAEIPKGILLEGPPGTGKTLLAKAIASETEANFISASASEFIELFVGMGAARIRGLFDEARENTPCIIFIDEIDSIGRQRGAGINMGNDEREQTLNQLLAEMDGFTQNSGVLVIAATNRRDVLDSALLRPGRFDRIVNVPLPDKNSRRSILQVHMKNKKMEDNINIEFLAEITSGFSGAELKNLVNEAAIFAARVGEIVITQKNLEDALEKLVVGIIKKTDTRPEDALERVALHELGHAIAAHKFSEYFVLKKVTIESTYSGAGGYTLFNELPEISEGGMYTKDLLKKRIVIALAGKAAELVFYGDKHVSMGAIQDLKQANEIAQQMIGNYGMGNELEVFYNENVDAGRNPFLGKTMGSGSKYSEKTKEKFDKEALEILNEAFKEAIDIITSEKSNIELIKNVLLEMKSIKGDYFNDLVKSYRG
jgi:cell division protease FtsH